MNRSAKRWEETKNKLPMFFSILIVSAFFAFKANPEIKSDIVLPTSIAISNDNKKLFVGDKESGKIWVIDLKSEKVIKEIKLPFSPSSIKMLDESKLLAVGGGCDGKLVVLDNISGKILSTIEVGHTPEDIAIDRSTKIVYVCNQFTNDVSVIDLSGKKEIKRIPVQREPLSLALTPDQKYLFVTNQLPVGPSTNSIVSAEVSVISTVDKKLIKNIILPNGSTGLKDICISPDGKYAYLPHILAKFQLPTTQLDRGWMNTNVLSIIDVKAQKLFKTILLDDVDMGAANPWGIIVTNDGKYLCISHAGTHEVSVISRVALHEKLNNNYLNDPYYGNNDSGNVINDFIFLTDIRKRIKLKGNGPRLMATANNIIYIAEYFSGSIGIVNAGSQYVRARSVYLGDNSRRNIEQFGEMLFHDAALCFQKWQSCTSCHPDGRTDGLNWDLLNDGIGNPKNVKSLLYAHKTPPVMSTGVRDRAETAVRSGINHIQFAIRPEKDALAIDEYLRSLQPVESPFLVKGKKTLSAIKGEKLFFSEKTNCGTCHPKPLYTDLKMYDVNTHAHKDFTINSIGEYVPQVQFDNPSLVELWRTAPYMHDGRYVTVKEIITQGDNADTHNMRLKLSGDEIEDLVAYLMSI